MTEMVVAQGLPTRRETPLDPPAELGHLRAIAPISRMLFPDGHLGWLVTGHAEVRAIMADNRFSARSELHHAPLAAGTLPRDVAEPGFFMAMDAPDHTRLRKLLAGQFTVRRMNRLADWISGIVADRIKEMRRIGPGVDLVKEFAFPVPSLVICELLGVPYADRARFQHDTADILDLRSSVQDVAAAIRRLQVYIGELVELRKVTPADDIVSDLIATGQLTDVEVTNMARMLLLAGHETTANMLALGTYTLLRHPLQLAMLRSGPSLIDNAVEELLRFLTIAHLGAVRTALEDVEIEGHRFAAGDTVSLSLPAANRDPARFGHPDEFDILQPATGHTAFGHGVHQCLGQQLARIEMRMAFTALFEAFPDLRFAVPVEEVLLRKEMAIYGVHEMPVTWTV